MRSTMPSLVQSKSGDATEDYSAAHTFLGVPMVGALQVDLLCIECRYSLRGLSDESCCPECGQRIRRSIAAIRLRRWIARRGPRPEISEGVIGLIFGLLSLFTVFQLLSSHRMPTDGGSYIIAGTIVGFSFTLLQSSVRRSNGYARTAAMLACGMPTILASALWLVIVISVIWRFRATYM
jgi:hypothetical protein